MPAISGAATLVPPKIIQPLLAGRSGHRPQRRCSDWRPPKRRRRCGVRTGRRSATSASHRPCCSRCRRRSMRFRPAAGVRCAAEAGAADRRHVRRGGNGAAGSPPPSTTGTVALGHTECDVVRGIGAPDNVSLSNNPRGDRVAVVNYSRGQRAGIYTFTSGRLTSIERRPSRWRRPGAQSRRRSRLHSSTALSGLSPPLRQIPSWPPASFPPPAAARFRRRRAPC